MRMLPLAVVAAVASGAGLLSALPAPGTAPAVSSRAASPPFVGGWDLIATKGTTPDRPTPDRPAPDGATPDRPAPDGGTPDRPAPDGGTPDTTTADPQKPRSSAALPGVPNGEAFVPRGSWTWPLAPRPQVVARFVAPEHRWSAGHRGVDLRAVVGQLVLAAGDGVVSYSGVIAGRGVITIQHAGGLRTTYEPVEDRAATGLPVVRGQPIGRVADTAGHCAPSTCLHWGAIEGQTYRNPLSLLGIGRPMLLPLG